MNRVQLLEYNYKQALRKQRSITSLFPTFGDRVRKVMRNGGPRMVGITSKGWEFTVASGTETGKEYIVDVEFENIEDTLVEILKTTREVFNRDNTVNYRKLADEFIDEVDIQWKCSCPADLYYGKQYIRTQRDANVPPPENRRPKIRNPKEYGFSCKHLETVLEKFPHYVMTMAKWLKEKYGNIIDIEVERIAKERTFFKAAGTFLGGLEKAQQNV
jgi:hypothetical protein